MSESEKEFKRRFIKWSEGKSKEEIADKALAVNQAPRKAGK